MSNPAEKDLLPEFESIKDDKEDILWTSKPVYVPFIFSGIANGLFMVAFGIIWILINFNIHYDNINDGSNWNYFWLIGLLPLFQGAYMFFNRLLTYSNTAYAYSDKRIMMRTGFIGTDFKTIDYDKISDIEVTVNIIEKMYNVGTIRFFSGRTQSNEDSTTKLYDSWTAIQDPYSVFKIVKQVSVDIKTDYNYPNALRPETNPGYKTEYKRAED